MKLHHWLILILAIMLIGTFVALPKSTTEKNIDEITGTWRADGINEDEFEWFMLYTFDNGQYTLTTGTGYEEKGTYRIKERFEDGSLIVEKFYDDGAKTYEMSVLTGEDPNVIFLEGVKLERQP